MICWDNVAIFICILFVWSIVCILIPAICLGPVMKSMRFSERILFYQIIAVVYCTAVTYVFSYLRFYNTFTILFGYMVVPIAIRMLIDRKKVKKKTLEISRVLGDLYQGRYGFRLLCTHLFLKCKRYAGCIKDAICKRGRLEFFGILIVFIGITVYFGTYKFTHYAYAAPDEEVHLYWVQSLAHNNIFPAGMYPHGMHSILALICRLIPIQEVRVVLNYSTVIVMLNMLALYVLMKKMQCQSFTALAAIAFFGFNGFFLEEAYSRFQYTVPMEFGMAAIPALVIALLNLLSENTRRNRILFVFPIIYTVSAHFYVAIIAAVVCFGFGIVYLWEILKQKILKYIIILGIAGGILSCLPFAIGFVLGYPFEQSMDWALGVMTGGGGGTKAAVEEELVPEEEGSGEVEYWLNEEGGIDVVYREAKEKKTSEKLEALKYRIRRIRYGCENGVKLCVNNEAAAIAIVVTPLFVFLYGGVFRRIRKKKRRYFKFCQASALSFLLLLFMACFYSLGLPEIVDANRIKVFLYLWYTVLAFVLYEMLADFCRWKVGKKVIAAAALLGSVGILAVTDNLDKNKYIYCVNQDGAMYACLRIMQQYEDSHFTVVSTTNELSVVRYHGFHVEWIDFFAEQIKAKEGDVYTIPTEDVFFIIEKRMLNFGVADYEDNGWGTEILGRISRGYADMDIDKKYLDDSQPLQRSGVYKEQRRVIMSKAYYWAVDYEKYYYEDFSKIYETRNVVVYHLKQNPYALNNLLLSEGGN